MPTIRSAKAIQAIRQGRRIETAYPVASQQCHCGNTTFPLPIMYADGLQIRPTNYVRCPRCNCVHRREGCTLADYTIRQWRLTRRCHPVERLYKPGLHSRRGEVKRFTAGRGVTVAVVVYLVVTHRFVIRIDSRYWSDWPIRMPGGIIAYDHPELVTQIGRRLVAKAYRWLDQQQGEDHD